MDDLIDFFAGLAMAGLLSAKGSAAYMGELTETAYEVAEAMIEQRDKRKEREVNERR